MGHRNTSTVCAAIDAVMVAARSNSVLMPRGRSRSAAMPSNSALRQTATAMMPRCCTTFARPRPSTSRSQGAAQRPCSDQDVPMPAAERGAMARNPGRGRSLASLQLSSWPAARVGPEDDPVPQAGSAALPVPTSRPARQTARANQWPAPPPPPEPRPSRHRARPASPASRWPGQ